MDAINERAEEANENRTPASTPPHDDQDGEKNVLKVKSDPKDISAGERRDKVKALAGAIAHGLRQFGEVKVRCFGAHSVLKGANAIAIASGFVSPHGLDLYCRPTFITMPSNGKNQSGEMTGIQFIVVASEMS